MAEQDTNKRRKEPLPPAPLPSTKMDTSTTDDPEKRSATRFVWMSKHYEVSRELSGDSSAKRKKK